MRYSICRSSQDHNRHLIFEQTCFDELPADVRNQDSWQHLKSGEFIHLRPDYKKAIDEHQYIIVEQATSVFSAES